jgi:glycosyltransferase involved in cell wall biosynthesis
MGTTSGELAGSQPERRSLMFKLNRKQERRAPACPDDRPTVALVIDAIFPYHLGGREVRYHELTRRLASRASVHVFTMHWWQGPRTVVDGSVTFHAISRLHVMYAHGRRSITQAIGFALACFRLIGHQFDVLDADHIPYFQILVLRLIASAKRKRLVVTWHEVWGLAYWRKYLGLLGFGAWLIEWLAMRLPDHIIAASPQTEQRLRAILGARASITVAPNGVDLDTIRGTHADDATTDLVCVGRLIGHKRVGMLLEAMALLHAEGLPVTCRIIGDGPEREALHHEARALGLSHAVDFRHEVREQKDVYALVKAATVAVFPSDREGFGAAVLEALACGVPVVTTTAPDNLSQHLVVRSVRGHLCEPSERALADVLKNLLADPELLTDQEDAWLDDYSWEAVSGQVASALRV